MRTKILGIALILVFFLGIVAIVVVRASMQNVVAQELELRAASLAQDIANRTTDAILYNNLYQLNQQIYETKDSYTDIRYIIVLDTSGRILAHTFGAGFPAGLLSANTLPTGSLSHVKVLLTTEGQIWDAAAPIFKGQVGIIRLGLSDALLGRSVNTVTIQLLLATLLVSTVGILLAIFLTSLITDPIQQLAQVAHAVGKGDLNQQVRHHSEDEIGELADSFNAMIHNLSLAAEANQERDRLRAELVERVINAQEDERKRIACDLHDQTSQALVSLIVQLKLVESARSAAARKSNIEALREQLRAALGEVRQMALDLRPSVLDDLGLEQAVRWFAERCGQNDGLSVTVSIEGDLNRLPEKHTITVYRIIQEAMSNIVKHSQASVANVKMTESPGRLWLLVADNGKGFVPDEINHHSGGLGIMGMKERVALLGGTISIQSSLDEGTNIQADFPIP